MKRPQRETLYEEVEQLLNRRLRGKTLTKAEAYDLSLLVLREISKVTL